MSNIADAIHCYIRAKDGNRPFLLSGAFIEEAEVQMVVRTDSIVFPSSLSGRDEIADILVSQFNQKYENIYTICIGEKPEIACTMFSCQWLVVMSEKHNGSLRIGCGRYDWNFQANDNRAKSLSITIDIMDTGSSALLEEVLTWTAGLSYPWCELSAIAKDPPNDPTLSRVVQKLQEM